MRVVGTRVHAITRADATAQILRWAAEGESRYVCAANVHMVMEARDDSEFSRVLEGASLVTPDGMPLVWVLRRRGFPEQPRVYGPDLMLSVCAAAAREGVPIGLHGGRPEALGALRSNLERRFPGLRVVHADAPAVGEAGGPSEVEISSLRGSGVRVLFVAFGCPKQERWMAAAAGRIPAVMLGVGAAFDFHGGRVRQAPSALREAGLEWLFRLVVEPRRLGRRYVKHNPRFVWHVAREFWALRGGR